MEHVLLSALGGHHTCSMHPPMDLGELDALTLHLQINTIDWSTSKAYATGGVIMWGFACYMHCHLIPLPLHSHYIAYTSQFIASGLKYLTGVCHFLGDAYPEFDANWAHPLVTTTVRGPKKVRADHMRCKLCLHMAHLQMFLNVAQCRGSYDDLLFAAIMSCAFYGCHQMGEIVQKNYKSLFDWWKIIKCVSLVFENGHAQYHLPYHKGDPFFRGTDIPLHHRMLWTQSPAERVCPSMWWSSWGQSCIVYLRKQFPPHLLMVWHQVFCSSGPSVWGTLSLGWVCNLSCRSWCFGDNHSGNWLMSSIWKSAGVWYD